MASMTIYYHTLVRSLIDGPTDEDCQDNQACVASHLDRYLDYVRGVVEASGHQVEVDYDQEWGPCLRVGSTTSYEAESDLERIIETIPPFWDWYN